jgi:hypothetical protein
MPLIRNIEPDARELIAYVVAHARERRITLNRTRLVKLLYLVDVESVRAGRDPITGFEWSFLEFGPAAAELIAILEDMERRTALYRAAPDDAPDGENWISGTRRTVDGVVERFAPLPPNELLDRVYFHTGPMSDACPGQRLDIRRARDDAGPRRPLPLRPPSRPEDVEQRLSQWRARMSRRLGTTPALASGVVLEDVGDDLEADGVRGRLRVCDGCEL